MLAFTLFALAGPAAAQGPLLELSQQVVEPGATISVTVIGPPFHFYGVASSPSNAGLAPGFELGPVFTVIGSGQLDADGRAVFPFTVPASPSPLYVQGATSPDPGFAVFVPTPGKTLTVEDGQIFGGGVVLTGTGTVFGGVNSNNFPSSEPAVQSVMPRACVASALYGRANPGLTAGQQIVVALRVNASDSLTCTMNETASTCTSGSVTKQILQGDLIAVRFSATNATSTGIYFGFVCH
jgi:hypothetical protein